jgi:hypothetical protein
MRSECTALTPPAKRAPNGDRLLASELPGNLARRAKHQSTEPTTETEVVVPTL